jgi:hypothetical protein
MYGPGNVMYVCDCSSALDMLLKSHHFTPTHSEHFDKISSSNHSVLFPSTKYGLYLLQVLELSRSHHSVDL